MINEKEVWLSVKGYEGHYQVSNLVRVKSLERTKGNRFGGLSVIKERILKPAKDNGDYLSVILYKNNIRKTFKVHTLIAIVFLNHKTSRKIVVNHINFNRLDNRLENLEIVTQRINANKKHLKSYSKYVGVFWNNTSKKWSSQITINGKRKFLGLSKDELEASKLYETALKNHLNTQ